MLLPSLDHPPSWLNRAGRIDRSACFVLTAGQVKKVMPPEAWRPARSYPAPGTRRTTSKTHREAAAAYTLTTRLVQRLHDQRTPEQLQGDRRTEKSNAMKRRRADAPRYAPRANGELEHASKTSNQRQQPAVDTARPSTHPAPIKLNPNAGAAFSSGHLGGKIFGLPFEWTQPLRLERWRLHEKLAQTFLICQNCLPPEMANKDATKLISAKHTQPARCRMLFLPLCFEREIEDAERARLWLYTYPKADPAERVKLQSRYALLFPPRRLMCRKCLGLRYGEVTNEGS